MARYKVKVRVWPYSTTAGAKADRDACGPETQLTFVTADRMDQALQQAQLYADGIKTNPRVWQATVIYIEEM